RGRSFNTSHFKGGFHPPLEPLHSKPGLSEPLGGARGAEPRLVEGLQGDPSPCGGIQRGACPPLRVQRRESCPPSNPSHAQTLCEEGAALAREGENILYISFQRGIASPFETLGEERKRGKIIYLFGDGGF